MEKPNENLEARFKKIANDLFKGEKPNQPNSFLEVSENDYKKRQEKESKRRQLEEQQVEEFLKIIEKK